MRGLISFFLFLLLAINPIFSQVYTMADMRVDDCRGTLTDSEAGVNVGHYDHNEDFTFTICVPGASSITMTFLSFCTEAQYDVLRLFDGPDTFAVQMGPGYSGINVPPTVTTTGSCLTIHFKTDANVTCTGWLAQWTTQLIQPILPSLIPNSPTVNCSTQTASITFTQPLHCDSVNVAAFNLSGPMANTVTAVNPINCTNDSTQTFQLVFSPGLNRGGFYSITYTGYFRDQCDSLWLVTSTDSVAVRNCPLEVIIDTDPDTICLGDCADLYATASGGDFSTYSYAWNNGLPNSPGTHSVCPLVTTTYTVTVSDAAGSTPATISTQIVVLPPPTTNGQVTICENDPPITLVANPPGGYWDGLGISDPANGTFDPDSTGPGLHIVQYYGPNGCPVDQRVLVKPIDAGPPMAACPSSGNMPLPLGRPLGGVWSGPFVVGSFFNVPATIGVYTVRLTHNNGCVDSTLIYVDTITLTPIDTICESRDEFALTFWPPGGAWVGNGITSRRQGLFDAATAGLGSHTLRYNIFGCSKQFDIFVKAINVGVNLFACPEQTPFTLPIPSPAGGIWRGQGIIDSLTGLFDPAVNSNNNFTATLTYVVDGCEADLRMRVRQTDIGLDSFEFCLEDTFLTLNWAGVKRTPWNGTWSGPGVTRTSASGRFEALVAGSGSHTLIYIANTCVDSMNIIVHGETMPPDTSVCAGSPSFLIRVDPVGGDFFGTGVDPVTGIFSPNQAGVGVHKLYYTAPTGCTDSMLVDVFQPVRPTISNFPPILCFNDTLIPINVVPAGGVFSGPGVSGGFFNPSVAGPGQHTINYEIGSGPCKRTTLTITSVGTPLELQLAFTGDTTICPGDFITLNASGNGGPTANYNYEWNPGNLKGASVSVNPSQTTTYTVTLRDGCTQPVSDQVLIEVSPEFSMRMAASGPVCYGESGWVTAIVNGPSVYEIKWGTNPAVFGDTFFSTTVFNHPVVVTDIVSGCKISDRVDIPFYPFVRAKFSANPDGECLRITDPDFEFIDFSIGGVAGTWDFGDSTISAYVQGIPVRHTYEDTGRFVVTLHIQNEGGCVDSFMLDVCVIPEESGFAIANAFSPNGDAINDIFKPAHIGVQTYKMQIFDRWGKLIFESNHVEEGWDGKYRGQAVPEGVYIYVIKGSMQSNNALIHFKPLVLEQRGMVTLIR